MRDYIHVYPYRSDYIVHNTTNSGWIVVTQEEYSDVLKWKNGEDIKNQHLNKMIKIYRLDKEEKVDYDSEFHQAIKGSVPETVYIVTTQQCNLRCLYCYAEADITKKVANELSLNEYTGIFKQLVDVGVKTVVFTGGESAMKKDIYEMIKSAYDVGLNVCVISNGSLAFRKEKAEFLTKYCNRITISLDSLEPELNDRNRGKGCFRIAKKAIDNLIELGYNRLAINQTVTNVNYDSIKEMREFARKHGIQLNVGPYCEMGRGKRSPFSLEKEERIGVELESIPTKSQMKPLSVKLHCGQGIGEFSIDPIGNVYTCKLLDTPHFIMGNIRVKPLKDIIGNNKMLNKAMKQSVNNLKCKDCPYKYLCGGSCRASHYYNTNDNPLGILDDECKVIQEMIKEHMWLYFNKGETINA